MRRRMLIPVAAMAATVAASPASAAPAGNGWSCLSPFANYVNVTGEADPPALNHILNSLSIDVTRTDSTALSAVPGQSLLLNDLQLKVGFNDARIAERMYTRTGGLTVNYPGIPYKQAANTSRNMQLRPNPDDNNAQWWSYTANSVVTFVEKPGTAGEPPKIRAQAEAPDGVWTYATASTSFGHRYIEHTGNNHFPLDAWVAVSASNTVEGVKVLPVKGYWTVNIKDATPGSATSPANYSNDPVTATVPAVQLNLPSSRWTPTGAGPVEFKVAPKGNLGIVQIESQGYDRVGYNTPLNVRPFGSVFVRAGSVGYGASNDCIPGQVSVVDQSITVSQPRLFFLDAPPVAQGVTMGEAPLGEAATPGQYLTGSGLAAAQGIRGRFGFAETAAPVIATAALPAPVTQPAVVKPVTLGSASSAKPSKAGSVKLSLTNPNTAAVSYKLTAKTVSKYALGKSKTKKVVTVAASKTVSVKSGATSVSLKLSKNAKTLLKSRKSVKVKVTLAPVSGGSAITKTITLKRA